MIDCHAHLAGEDFDADRDTVRQRAATAGVSAVLVVGEDPQDNDRVLQVLADAPTDGARMLPCLGFHPDRFADDRPLPTRSEMDAAIAQVRQHADKLAAIGEVGYLFSIPPSVVRSKQKQKLVRCLPLESIALESDSPVLGPDREARNEPANLIFGRDFIAKAHGISAERVDEITTANALQLFPQPASLTEEAAGGAREHHRR